MNARKKKVLTVLCIGSVVLVWRAYVLVTRYIPSSARAGSIAAVVEDDSAEIMPLSTQKDWQDVWEAQRVIAEELKWERNAFAAVPWADLDRENVRPSTATTPAHAPAPPQEIVFTGVSRSGDFWLAALSGEIVRVGDVIDDRYIVAKITKNSITLEMKGWAYTFQLGSSDVDVHPISEHP